MHLPQPRIPDKDRNEAGSLASELAAAYRRQTAFNQEKMHMEAGAADQTARGLDQTHEQTIEELARIRERPPDQLDWGDLQRVVNIDPRELVALWEHLKSGARDELASGHRTALALAWQGSPLDRARFLAVQDSFREALPPQSGIESALVDVAAEAFNDLLAWQEHLHMQAESEAATERDSLERHGSWSPARLSAAAAIEQSAKMAERAHRRFLQTVKMLHDLQRTSATVYVGHAGQINLGQQQVNVSSPARARKKHTDLPKSTRRVRGRRTIRTVQRRTTPGA